MDYDTLFTTLRLRRIIQQCPTEQEIAALEVDLGKPLPPSYRSFLKSCGGTASHSLYFGHINSGEPEFSVEVFYGFDPESSYDLRSLREGFSSDLPDWFLPIASTPGGLVLLSLDGNENLYWWNPSNGGDGNSEDLDLIASGFQSFLQQLWCPESKSEDVVT